jgi:hypothetical protein
LIAEYSLPGDIVRHVPIIITAMSTLPIRNIESWPNIGLNFRRLTGSNISVQILFPQLCASRSLIVAGSGFVFFG